MDLKGGSPWSKLVKMTNFKGSNLKREEVKGTTVPLRYPWLIFSTSQH